MAAKPSLEKKVVTVEDNLSYLNQYKVNIGNLRMFLASLSQDGLEEIPAGTLITMIKSYARKEGDGG